jgi:hypothetical protein
MNKIFKIIIWLIVLGFIAWGIYAVLKAPKIAEGDIVSRSGLHWHAHMTIKILGKEEVIPANIGVNGVMGAGGDPMQLHTHATDGIIHAEFSGLVTKDQMSIGNFFKVWGKDFSKDSILGHKAENGHTVKMYVDGKENTEYENFSFSETGSYKWEGTQIPDILIVYE